MLAKNVYILQLLIFSFYILDCVLLKIFSPFCWTWFQLLQKQLNLSKNVIFQINCFSQKKKKKTNCFSYKSKENDIEISLYLK